MVAAAIFSVAAYGQKVPCAFVTSASPLDAKLRCTAANNGRKTLSSFLLPIADQLMLSGKVQADPTLNIYPFKENPPKTIACSDSDHLSAADLADPRCVGLNNDGDVTFTIALDPESLQRLTGTLQSTKPLYDWWRQSGKNPNNIHIEILITGWNIADTNVRLLPGWRLDGGFLFNSATMRYDGFLDCQKWHLASDHTPYCESLWISSGGKTLKAGALVEITGALVLDCGDDGTISGCQSPSGLEIHPAYSILVK